jgi:hypothetical protein
MISAVRKDIDNSRSSEPCSTPQVVAVFIVANIIPLEKYLQK